MVGWLLSSSILLFYIEQRVLSIYAFSVMTLCIQHWFYYIYIVYTETKNNSLVLRLVHIFQIICLPSNNMVFRRGTDVIFRSIYTSFELLCRPIFCFFYSRPTGLIGFFIGDFYFQTE